MSGPKTSKYTLTPEQRRLLAIQREIERRKTVAQESIKRNQQKLLKMKGLFSSSVKVSEELLKRCNDDGGFSKKRKEIEDTITQIETIALTISSDDLAVIENTAQKVSDGLAKVETMTESLSRLSAENDTLLQSVLSAAIDRGFDTSFADVVSVTSDATDESKQETHTLLVQMKNNTILPRDLVNEIERVTECLDSIQDEEFLKNYSAVIVQPLLKRCQQFLSDYALCHEEFEKLYAEYAAICNLYGYVAQEYSCTLSSIDALKAEIQRIKKAADEDDEQTYIRDCIDETMAEMGYSVLGSREVTKKNGKHFRNELFTYEDGTAINVTYSSDGRIAMELGGIDDKDRLPSDSESALLCGSMERFCGDFKELEKRLLSKGVVLADRVSMLPPSAEYAQIINSTDFELTAKTDKLQVKKHRQASSKSSVLRKEQ